MRVTPKREMLEYLDSIGVKPPTSMSATSSRSGGRVPSAAGAKGKTGCLLVFLIPSFAAVAGSALLIRLLATIVFVVTLLVVSEPSVAQIPMPPDVGLTPEPQFSVVSPLRLVPLVDGLHAEKRHEYWSPLLSSETSEANMTGTELPIPASEVHIMKSLNSLNRYSVPQAWASNDETVQS